MDLLMNNYDKQYACELVKPGLEGYMLLRNCNMVVFDARLLMIAINCRACKGEKVEEEGNVDYRGIVQPSQQHVNHV